MSWCSICGGTEFVSKPVLWPELISSWGLSAEEVGYVDKQQGRSCSACGANLRINALGRAIQDSWETKIPIREFANDCRLRDLRILDINGAEAISPALQPLSSYTRADFPVVDMEALPYSDKAFDLVIHSDTLEHVPHPIRGLEECRRVLADGGRLCFTVPVIVGRLTRGREGMPDSWHGNPANPAGYLVRTEFGSDVWTYVLRAGFSRLSIHEVEFPAATAITAW